MDAEKSPAPEAIDPKLKHIERLVFLEFERLNHIVEVYGEWAWKIRAWAVALTAGVISFGTKTGATGRWALLGLYLLFCIVELGIRRNHNLAYIASGFYRDFICHEPFTAQSYVLAQKTVFTISSPEFQNAKQKQITKAHQWRGALVSFAFHGLLATIAGVGLAIA